MHHKRMIKIIVIAEDAKDVESASVGAKVSNVIHEKQDDGN